MILIRSCDARLSPSRGRTSAFPNLPPKPLPGASDGDRGYPEASATLFALGDGTTSLYLSTGGGVIGGQPHQNVREAIAEFVEAANRHYQHLKPTDFFPLPAEGQTVFYVLTDSGVLTGAGREEELGLWEHPLSSLFHEGHRVITQLRLISEDTSGGD